MLAEWDAEQTRCIEVSDDLAGWIRRMHRPDYDWLDLVVIGRVHRGKGPGRAVMDELVAQARARGVPLWLSVYRINRDRDPVRVLMGPPAGGGLAVASARRVAGPRSQSPQLTASSPR